MKQMETVKNDVGMMSEKVKVKSEKSGMGWEIVKLGDVLDYEQPTKYIVNSDLYDDNFTIPVLTAGKSFVLGYTNETEGVFTDLPVIIFDDFTTVSKYVDFQFKVKSSAMKILRAKEGIADTRYMFYLLQTLNLDCEQHKRYWISKFAPLEIPLPPLATQKRIAEILDAADALKRKDQELLKKYDELAQAIFIDMFGDPVKNEKGWEEVMLKDLSLKITDGTHLSPKFTSSGIPFLFVSNIVDNQIVYKTDTFISEEEFEVLNKRTPIEIGNILLTTVGSYGNPAIIEKAEKFAFQRHIAFIKPDHELVNYVYLFGFLQSPVAKFQIDKKVNGVAQKTLNLSDLKELKIWNVPKKLQDEYANRLMVLKTQIQSIPRTYSDTLFNSLLQKAFRGELY